MLQQHSSLLTLEINLNILKDPLQVQEQKHRLTDVIALNWRIYALVCATSRDPAPCKTTLWINIDILRA